MITAEEARRNAESCRSVIAESPLVDVDGKRLFVSEDISGKILEDIVSDEIFKEISKVHNKGQADEYTERYYYLSDKIYDDIDKFKADFFITK